MNRGSTLPAVAQDYAFSEWAGTVCTLYERTRDAGRSQWEWSGHGRVLKPCRNWKPKTKYQNTNTIPCDIRKLLNIVQTPSTSWKPTIFCHAHNCRMDGYSTAVHANLFGPTLHGHWTVAARTSCRIQSLFVVGSGCNQELCNPKSIVFVHLVWLAAQWLTIDANKYSFWKYAETCSRIFSDYFPISWHIVAVRTMKGHLSAAWQI